MVEDKEPSLWEILESIFYDATIAQARDGNVSGSMRNALAAAACHHQLKYGEEFMSLTDFIESDK